MTTEKNSTAYAGTSTSQKRVYKKTIYIAGDLIRDRHLYLGDRLTPFSKNRLGSYLVEEWGGPARTYDLLKVLFSRDEFKDINLVGLLPPEDFDLALWPQRLTGSTSWRPAPGPCDKYYWRMNQPFGYGPEVPEEKALEFFEPIKVKSHIVILDYNGDAFGDAEPLWGLPDSPAAHLPRWILFRVFGSFGKGAIWKRLESLRTRLITLVSSRTLREAGLRLSRGLSWERTAEHLIHTLRSPESPLRAPLSLGRHLVVNFEGDGAIWIDFSGRSPEPHIIFDPRNAEGEWGDGIEGDAFGFHSCLNASIAVHLARNILKNDELHLADAISQGLSAMRDLRLKGSRPDR